MNLASIFLPEGWEAFDPVIWLLIGASLAITFELSSKNNEKVSGAIFWTAVLTILAAAGSIWYEAAGLPRTVLNHGLIVDGYGLYFSGVILAGTLIASFASLNIAPKLGLGMGDYVALVLVSAAGMLLLVHANDLIMVFLALELMSLGVYVLAGINQRSSRSSESAMKYFVMGAFASGFLLFGMALLYGLTGEVRLDAVANGLANIQTGYGELAMLAVALMVIGFAFKIGAVPFHQWVPDVYSGAPTPVTALMSVAIKAAAFAAFGRFLMLAVPASGDLHDRVTSLLWLVAIASILIGNLLAVAQESIKRMLAYSGVAHSGYLLVGFIVALDRPEAMGAVMFYLAVYTLATGGAFALIAYCSAERDLDDPQDLVGLGWTRPGVGLAMTIFMLSAAGIPLTGGFIGKYWLFYHAIDAGYIWLTLLAIIGSMIGAFYYLRVVVRMYMKSTAIDGPAPRGEGFGASAAIRACALASVLLGVLPGLAMDYAEDAGKQVIRGAATPSAGLPGGQPTLGVGEVSETVER